MLNKIIDSKKIMSDVIKEFYKEKRKATDIDYSFGRKWAYKTIDDHTALLMNDGHAIYKVFKDELPFKFKETELKIGEIWDNGEKDETYKKATKVEKVIKTLVKKEYTLLKLTDENGVPTYVNNDLLKYFNGKDVKYEYYVKGAGKSVLIKVDNELFCSVCPIYVKE